jgi:acetyl esterase/lipase
MDINRVTAELRPAARRVAALMGRMPLHRAWFRRLSRVGARLAPTGVRLTGVQLDTSTPGLRIFRPSASTGALLWIHGGGLVVGAARMDDRFCADTARELGIVVASAEYRLAPENPYPAALDDCLAAWQWLLATAGPRIAVGGQSAGGGLAAALVQRLHDAAGPDPVAQWLFCPMLDDRTASRGDLDPGSHLIWNNRSNLFGWSSYLGQAPGGPEVPPYAVPARREDVSGLPPAWIGVGDIDLFHDENRTYAERLRTAGVDVTFRVEAGAPHAFEAWAPLTPPARAFVGDARDWLRAALGN